MIPEFRNSAKKYYLCVGLLARPSLRLWLLAGVAALACGGCASTKFHPYVGAKPIVGRGGAPEHIEGIDMWIEGTPSRKFIIIGIIQDERPGGRIPMAMRNQQVAQTAKINGGDGVLIKFDEREILGSVSSGQTFTSGQASGTAYGIGNMGFAQASGTSSTSGFGVSAAVSRRHARYYVIKYL